MSQLSGEVRFSVESLLYYAPKVTKVGEDLANEVNGVRRRLIDLGDFFGTSWMEGPFRSEYPRAQYAMILVAWALANEIQAIGGGIQQTARQYGIAEDQNTADVTRIRQNEDRTARVIHGTGGIQPPTPTHPNLPPPPEPPREPHPTPGRSPNPFQSQPPKPPQPPRPSQPPPSPTPNPRPGANPDNYHRSSSISITGPWPDGDVESMDQAAAAWRHLQMALDTAWADLRRYQAYIMADSQGAAAEAFSDYVDGLTATGGGAMTRAIQVCQDLRDMCLHQAEEVRSNRSSLRNAAIEFGLETGVAAAVVIFTAPAAEALEEGIADRFILIVARYASFLLTRSKKVAQVVELIGTGLSKAIPAGLQSAFAGQIDQVIHGEISNVLGGKGDPGELSLDNLTRNFAAGALGGIVSSSGKATSGKLNDLADQLAEKNGDRGEIRQLRLWAKQASESGVPVTVVNAFISKLISQGKVTPKDVLEGTISSRLSSAIKNNAT